jgi:hypothetical protein
VTLAPEAATYSSHHLWLRVAAYGAIVCALPYLALKCVWLAGGTLGVADIDLMRDSTMFVLNAITAAMDVVGIMLALAFAHPWGMRISSLLLLPPIWVATGLLTRFVAGVPLFLALSAVSSGSVPRNVGGPVQDWVYLLVYTGFAGLGIGLTCAFALYAMRRWPAVFERRGRVAFSVPPQHLETTMANAIATVALALSIVHVVWAFGISGGGARSLAGSVLNGIDAALTIAAAAGLLMIVHERPNVSPWLPVAMAWIGTSAIFSWSLWQTANALGQTALMRGAEDRALENLVGLVRLLVGLTAGLLMLFALSRRIHSQ